MSFFTKIKNVVQTEGARGIRQVLQKEGTKRLAQDLSAGLSIDTLNFCETRRYGLPALISSIAVDPIQGLLATGTYKGAIAVTGGSEVVCYLELEEGISVKMLAFQPGSPILVALDVKNAITVFDLIKKQRLFVRNARNIVTCMELLSGSNWLFQGLRDGTVDVFDVYRGQTVHYKIPNIIPDGKRNSMVVSIQAHPIDSNQLLIAYNTGVVLWNIIQKTVIRTFIYEIPPGATGGIAMGNNMMAMNEYRYPHVTVISWRPDGQGFVGGYDDGCFVFWDIRQERPVLARTVHELNVNIPGTRPAIERENAQFVPIYRLTWCLHANKEDMTLIVAGGTSSLDMFGLHLYEYPPRPDYKKPRRHQTLPMESDILDFIVLPRNSPWYNGALDPLAVLVLTNKGGIKAYSFNPPYAQHAIPSCLTFAEPKVLMTKVYGPLSPDQYSRLVNGLYDIKKPSPYQRLPIFGGKLATVDESRVCHDILVTAHDDCSIRFWEGASFQPIRHLTTELGALFFKNQTEIVAFEYSIQSQVLTVGFANGHWVYGRLSKDGNEYLARQSNIAQSVHEGHIADALATEMERGLNITNSQCDPSQQQEATSSGHFTEDYSQNFEREQSFRTGPAPTHGPDYPSREEYARSQAPSPSTNQSRSNSVRSQSSLPGVNSPPGDHGPTSPFTPGTIDPSHEHSSPPPESVEGKVVSPEGRYLDPTPPLPDRATTSPLLPPLPDRGPSPSLPPRPQFMEACLNQGAEFSPVTKSNSTHLGRINQIAISDCGLVAVSDEFYSLSITDTRTGRLLHVEDLKVVMLDQEKIPAAGDGNVSSNHDEHHRSHQVHPNHNPHAGANANPLDPSLDPQQQEQSLQRVGVVISSLEFIVSTTSDQDKTPSLLLLAGSTEGVYIIFAIEPIGLASPPMSPPQQHQQQQQHHEVMAQRRIRKVETFQTKEKYASVHTSIINVLTPESAPVAQIAMQSTTSLSSVSTATSYATTATGSSMTSLPHHDKDLPSHPPPLPSRPLPVSSAEHHPKPSIYSTLKDAQDKVMTKAHQRLNYLVCVSEYSVRVHMNCTSRRIHKVDLLNHPQLGPNPNREASGATGPGGVGRIMAANVIYHQGACCLLCLTETGRILLFSIPKLELISLGGHGGALTPSPGPGGNNGSSRGGREPTLELPIVLEKERLRTSVILSDGRLLVPILKFEFRMYSLWGHDLFWKSHRVPNDEASFSQQGRTAAGNSEAMQLYDPLMTIPLRPSAQLSVTGISNTGGSGFGGWLGSVSNAVSSALTGEESPPKLEDLDQL
ncbi:hypothetical protein BGW38_006496, partial [Lunasporangiospora selenospora]